MATQVTGAVTPLQGLQARKRVGDLIALAPAAARAVVTFSRNLRECYVFATQMDAKARKRFPYLPPKN